MNRDYTNIKISLNFHELIKNIQIERIKRETDKKFRSLKEVTKMISNMINSNPKMFDKLVEAEDGQRK